MPANLSLGSVGPVSYTHLDVYKRQTVRDNGSGFPDRSLRQEGRYGLLGMRERALALGGRLDIDTPPGGGGRITVHLPLAARAGGPGNRP